MKSWLKRRSWRTRILLVSFLLAGLFALVGYGQLQRDPPALRLAQTTPESYSKGDAPLTMPWPRQGSAAVSVAGAGVVGATKDDPPRSIASLVKVMTAYVVLKDHPLKAGEAGPTIKVEPADVQFYRQQLGNGESVVAVSAGTEFSQRNLLEGLLIPSGNNLAFMLAGWSSGSVEAFVGRMNQEAEALGMKDTRYVEPSGVDAANVSTARDQIRLAEAAMTNVELARIVGLKQASLPAAGIVFNVNSLLGQDGLVGVKTGWTEEAGACFLFASDRAVGERKVRVIGVVLGQDTLADAFNVTRGLLGSLSEGLEVVTLVAKGAPAATLSSAWGASGDAVAERDVSVVVWPGLAVETRVERTSATSDVKQGAEVGKLVVKAGPQSQEVPLLADQPVSGAGLVWRLTRTLP